MIKVIRNFLNNLSLNARFNLFISILLVIIFTFLGYYLYYIQKQDIFKNSDSQLRVLLEDLVNIFEVQTNQKEKSIESTMKFAESFFYQMNGIRESDSVYIDFQVRDERFGSRTIKLKKWYFNNTQLQYNYDFVDFIKGGGVDFASIFQKTPEGFVRISTNILTIDSTRAVGTFMPPNSEVIQTIQEGKRFTGRVNIMNDWYLTSFSPIFVDGEINAILGIGVRQIDYDIVKPLFYNKTYFNSGYPFALSGDGISIINPNPEIEGKDQKGTSFFRKLVAAKENNQERFRYKWPETEDGSWKYAYLKYFEPLDIYIATSLYEEELYTGIDQIIQTIIIGILVSIFIFFIGISFIIRPITNSIKKLSQIIYTMSKGRMVEKVEYGRKDEIGDIINSLNLLIQGWTDTSKFSNEIEKGNFSSRFTPLSKDDILGNALLDMRESLKKANEEERKRKIEDDKRNWTSEGLSMFNDILRRQSTVNIAELSAEIMHKLIKYLNANQGGLFVYNDDDPENQYFELISAYAYDRKKYFDKKVKIGEGLVGTCAIERETIYLKEIPEDYIEIESGLGDTNPNVLVLVPMKLDERVFGVIEIASFNQFEEYEIQFIEKLGENIASTLATAKMNLRTQQLLKESREQSEKLAIKEEQMRKNLAELQAAQDESAKRQAEMSGVVAALDASFFVSELNLEGRILDMNRAFYDMLGINKKEAINKFKSEFIILDDEQKDLFDNFWKNIDDHKDGVKIQSKRISKTGEEYWLSETFTPICDNNGIPYKILNIAVDITQNKRQEFEIQQLLEDSRKKAKKLAKQEKLNTYNVEKLAKTQAESARKETELKSILDGIDSTALRGEYAPDGTILSVNENYLRVLSYSEEEMLGKNNKLFIPAEEMLEFEKAWEKTLSGKVYKGIVKRNTKRGKVIWLLMSYTPITDKNNNLSKVLFLANDITAQKENEKILQKNSKELEEGQKELKNQLEKLKVLHRELETYKHEVEAIIQLLGDNNPLVYIDINGRVIECNKIAEKEFSITTSDIKTTQFKDLLITDDEKVRFSSFWHKVLNGETVREQYNVVKNGKKGIINELIVPVIDENGKIYKAIYIRMKHNFS